MDQVYAVAALRFDSCCSLEYCQRALSTVRNGRLTGFAMRRISAQLAVPEVVRVVDGLVPSQGFKGAIVEDGIFLLKCEVQDDRGDGEADRSARTMSLCGLVRFWRRS